MDGGILLDGAEISGTLYFAPETCGGEIDLSGATIGKIHDEYALTDCVSQNWWTARKRDFGNNFKDRWQALFPPKNPHKTTEGDVRQKQYKLYGLRYKELEPGMCSDWRELVEWIRNADGGAYHPQPYERLAAVLQAHGHENEASEVLIARRRHRLQNLTLPRRAAEILLYDVPILFGYKPWQAVYIAVALICLGGFQFHRAAQQNLLVPTDGDVLTVTVASRNEFVSGELRRTFRAPLRDDWNAKKKRLIAAHPLTERDDSGRRRFVPDGYPEFNAAIYALDAFLPIIDLRQTEYWLPNRSKPGGVWYSKLYWFLDISGWFLTTLLVSSLTGLVRGKDTETIEP